MPPRNETWVHNSYHGWAAMTRGHMVTICASKTATPETKAIASEIRDLSEKLKVSLEKRVK